MSRSIPGRVPSPTAPFPRKAAGLLLLATAQLIAGTPVARAQVAASATPAPATISSTIPAELRPAIEAFRERALAAAGRDTVGGATVAVVDGDKVIWVEGFGWADNAKRIAAGAETIYRIGSLSKTFTAVALMQLIDQGVVKLDDPVERYLPEIRGLKDPRPGAKPITLRMLASHTAGLIREPRLQGAAAGPIAEWENKVLASIPTVSFDSEPGTKYLYSNIGFGILGLTVSRAAGTPFMQLIEDGIFKPLGMTSSTFIIDDRLRPQLSVGYTDGPNGTVNTEAPAREHAGRGYKVPNGGIYSTVGDLARFMGALSGASKPVTSDSLRVMMTSKQTPASVADLYGFGTQLRSNGVVGHGGSVAGYNAAFDYDARTRLGVIVLMNGLSLSGSQLGGRLLTDLVAARGGR